MMILSTLSLLIGDIGTSILLYTNTSTSILNNATTTNFIKGIPQKELTSSNQNDFSIPLIIEKITV